MLDRSRKEMEIKKQKQLLYQQISKQLFMLKKLNKLKLLLINFQMLLVHPRLFLPLKN